MRFNYHLVILLAFVFSSLAGKAQKTDGRNMVKLNLSGAIQSAAHLQYERQIGRKTTFAFGVGIRPKAGIPWPFKGYIKSIVDNENVHLDSFRMSGVILTPEIRFYLGKGGAFHGFYLAPYARAGFYKMSGPVSYIARSTNGFRRVDFDGSLTAVSGGLMAGASFDLAEQLYLDLWIVGISFGYESSNMRGNSNLSNPDDQTGLNDVLKEINIPLTNLKYTIDPAGATVKTTGGVFGGRGLGICLGLRF